jgi:DNA-binding MarR family transcriptional regulator
MTRTPESPPSPGNKRPNFATDDAVDALEAWLSLIKEGVLTAMHEFDLPAPYIHALGKIDGPVSMKEVGVRLDCDPSFVTAIADVLESKGLARREVDRLDRRVKNLVLTPEGERARAVLQRDFYDNFPGIRRLSPDERSEFIGLLHKMVDAELAAGKKAERKTMV